MSSLVLNFQQIGKATATIVGGKAANLAELTRIEGIAVPDGCCISTEAFKRIILENPALTEMLDQLSLLSVADRDTIGVLSARMRRLIEQAVIPTDIREAITQYLSQQDEKTAWAIRSSATAEDLPTASFAGQQNTYLNVTGKDAVLQHISKCWASLFEERAILYRLQNGFDHRKVWLAVVIQQMIFPDAAGIVFTADPVTSNRKIVSIDAGFGLGEAMVAGLVNADNYSVCAGSIIDKKISAKQLALIAAENGGTKQQKIEPDKQRRQTLTDEQILQLESIARKIEKHFGHPQDIEWCLKDKQFFIVQSRPITTLYPIPEVHDQQNHVYISVGHQQMMTDPMKPLGIAMRQLIAARPMYEAGGRLFVDVAQNLATPAGREMMIDVLGKSDPLIKGALINIVERKDFIPSAPVEQQQTSTDKSTPVAPLADFNTLVDYDPSIVAELIKRSETAITELKHIIQTKSGPALFDFILEDMGRLRQSMADPQSFGVFMTAMNASSWINEKIYEWLGEKNVADTISQSVPNNITSAMGLELLDVADIIRPYPELINYLQHATNDDFLEELNQLEGGREARNVINHFLNKYGMRCAGEIDITRPRWSEKPTTLISVILSNIKNVAPGESKRKFEEGLQQAMRKEQEIFRRLAVLPGGEEKVKETQRMIGLVRSLIGYREYPKYELVSRYFVYKQALMKEASQLAKDNSIDSPEDIYYLSFEELHELVRSNQSAINRVDYQIIRQRKDKYHQYKKLTPPRVITSDGEIITGKYTTENLPAGAIAGLAVSAGLVEGRARVLLNMEDADLDEGDILVTTFTDPSWTPLFVTIKGLVTEVGGLMTHGAVIAREYGLPAVVGVENATTLIRDGQRIRVHGTDGYVEIL